MLPASKQVCGVLWRSARAAPLLSLIRGIYLAQQGIRQCKYMPSYVERVRWVSGSLCDSTCASMPRSAKSLCTASSRNSIPTHHIAATEQPVHVAGLTVQWQKTSPAGPQAQCTQCALISWRHLIVSWHHRMQGGAFCWRIICSS